MSTRRHVRWFSKAIAAAAALAALGVPAAESGARAAPTAIASRLHISPYEEPFVPRFSTGRLETYPYEEPFLSQAARVTNGRPNDQSPGTKSAAVPVPSRPVTSVKPDAFKWREVVIAAAITLALMTLISGAAVLLRRRAGSKAGTATAQPRDRLPGVSDPLLDEGSPLAA